MEKRHNLPIPEGTTPRMLEQIAMPIQVEFALRLDDDAVRINNDIILFYHQTRRGHLMHWGDAIFVSRERSKPVRVIETRKEVSLQDPCYEDIYRTLFLGLYGFYKRFYVGEDYRVEVAPAKDRKNYGGEIAVRVSSDKDMSGFYIPPRANFALELSSLNNR